MLSCLQMRKTSTTKFFENVKAKCNWNMFFELHKCQDDVVMFKWEKKTNTDYKSD